MGITLVLGLIQISMNLVISGVACAVSSEKPADTLRKVLALKGISPAARVAITPRL